ncbi:hypothetical protein D3C73_1055380 [compost metagenome]
MQIGVVGRAGLQDAALVHQRQVVGHQQGLLGVVGDHQNGGVGGAQGAHQRLAYLGFQVPIQAREGLVQQDGVRPPGQGAHQGHALLLAARQHMRPGVGPVGQMHRVQPLQRRAAALGARPVLQPEGDVVGHAEVRKQGVVLKY